MPYTILASTKNVLWKVIELYDHNPEHIFLEAGIDPELLKNPGARIKFSSVNKLWNILTKIIDDPCVGLHALKFWHPSNLHALGYAWLASHTLRDALNRFARYSRILSEADSILLEEDSETFSLILESKFAKIRLPERIDMIFAIIVQMCRANYGDELKPISVNFVHSEPSCSEQFFNHFRSEVSFSESRNCIVFSLVDIDKYLSGSNPHLANINDQVILQYLSGLGKDNISDRVKSCIIDMIQSGNVSGAEVAKRLGLSERGLQRQLMDEGTTFLTLKDEVRKELSLSYVRDRNIEISEIAFLLGYSDQSTFSRSFKRMTGMSPSEVRGGKRLSII